MGIIYMLTSPEMSYVGQTIRTFDARLKEHIRSAYLYYDYCPKLCEAIRENGIESFQCEIIDTYEDPELNEKEKYWIEVYNKLYPNGYNLTKGGSGWSMSKEAREYIVNSHRKYTDYKLPIYVSVYKKGNVEGFRIIKPACETVIICSMKLTMEEKYAQALEIYAMTPTEISLFNEERKEKRNKENKLSAGDDFPLETYMSYIPPLYEGFTIRFPGNSEKKFNSISQSLDEKYMEALEFLEFLKNGGEYHGEEKHSRTERGRELLPGMQYHSATEGIIVFKPGAKKPKYYQAKRDSWEEKKRKAFEYYNS